MEFSETGAVEAYNLSLAFVPCMVAKAICELGIPDILAAHEGPMSALHLVQLLHPQPTRPLHEAAEQLDRMMRCLCAYKVFQAHSQTSPDQNHKYSLTPLSRCLQRGALHELLLLNTSPQCEEPWHCLSQSLLYGAAPFVAAHSKDLWGLAAADPSFNRLFNSGMASVSRFSSLALLRDYDGFQDGIHSIVDVGGGIGLTASHIAARYPSIKVINFDLPVVVSTAPPYPGVQHVGGDMFETIPPGDAILMKAILHGWPDEDCIKVLQNCQKVLPQHGKLIIMEVVLDSLSTQDSPLQSARFALDMVLQAYSTGGKERTKKQWELLLGAANFSISRIINLPWITSIIEAIPLSGKP